MHNPPLDPAEVPDPVAVITGGWSRERDRALLSGSTAVDNLPDMSRTSTPARN